MTSQTSNRTNERTPLRPIHYHYAGLVERGNGRPGYDWHDGYSENGNTYPWLTKRECRHEAAARGGVARFYRDGKPEGKTEVRQ